MTATEQVERIISAATEIARLKGLHTITLQAVGNALDMAHSNVSHHIGTVERLRDMTARRAIKNGDKKILASMITTGHPLASEIPATVRRNVVQSFG